MNVQNRWEVLAGKGKISHETAIKNAEQEYNADAAFRYPCTGEQEGRFLYSHVMQ